MPPQVVIALLALVAVTQAAPQPNCSEFSRGVTFSSSQAEGTWYLMRMQPYAHSNDAYCSRFSLVTDQERRNLTDQIGKYVDVKWENLVLKMQIPCAEEGELNRNRDYYLERLDMDGSYQTLQIPANVSLETAGYNRHPMRLKLVEGKYLAMMDCREHFMFLLDREPHAKELSPALKKVLEEYLPNEYS